MSEEINNEDNNKMIEPGINTPLPSEDSTPEERIDWLTTPDKYIDTYNKYIGLINNIQLDEPVRGGRKLHTNVYKANNIISDIYAMADDHETVEDFKKSLKQLKHEIVALGNRNLNLMEIDSKWSR